MIPHRDLDMVMAACFNSAERTKDDWLKLLNMVDERLVFRSITRPEGSTMSIVEAVWHSS